LGFICNAILALQRVSLDLDLLEFAPNMSDRVDIESVREATDLVALISGYVPLQPKGREWLGLCPFHEDSKPSFTVVTHKQNAFYKCHACGASGDCYKFVQEYLKKDFSEALRYLADKAGINLSNNRRESTSSESKSKLRAAMKWASDLFITELGESGTGEMATAAISTRGFNETSMLDFLIGVAPEGWTFLSDRVRDDKNRTATCIAAGLVRKKEESGRIYDTFRNRLMFPICDESGCPIGFGARRLDEKDEPKYINSPETPLFQKSKTLYGLHLANRTIRERNFAVVVEGYTDVIACHQAGLTNVVATLGTSLTKDHAIILSRICDEVILVFDGDEAGQRAADRAVEVFITRPIDVRICVLPAGQDPADLASAGDTLQQHLDNACDAITYKLKILEKQVQSKDTLSGRQKVIESCIQNLATLGLSKLNGVRRPLILEKIASLLGTTMHQVETILSNYSTPHATHSQVKQEQEPTQILLSTIPKSRVLAEREFLAVCLYDPTESSAALREQGEDHPTSNTFIDPTCASIANIIMPALVAGTPRAMQETLSELEDPARMLASSLFFDGQRLCEETGSVMLAITTTLHAFNEKLKNQSINNQVHQVKQVVDPAKRAEAAQLALESMRQQKTTGCTSQTPMRSIF
jgi:DNA primase catalytic core